MPTGFACRQMASCFGSDEAIRTASYVIKFLRMRAAAILGPGNLAKTMLAFQRATNIQWTSLIEQADVVVIFGGDGTIHRHLSTLVELEVPVLIVPCGSGNDFARALSIRNVRDSVKGWRKFAAGESKARAIDLGVITGCTPVAAPTPEGPALIGKHVAAQSGEQYSIPNYFCCVAGVGIDTEIARRANALPRWLRSHGGYAISAPGEFFRFAPFPMKISGNGSPATFRPTMLAAVANAPAYGGGMKIAPQAKLDDGKLDLCIVRAMDTFKLFCLFPTVYFGRHLGFREVEYAQSQSVKIETEHPFDVYADGEFVCQTPAEFSVAQNALEVIIPD
jgi:diacylglycerol kinase (ATP)